MNSGLVYVAEPIDLGEVNPELVEKTINAVQAGGHTVYRPKSAFKVGGTPSGFLSQINQEAMEQANAMVAFLPKSAKSVGVPSEIEWFIANDKPVLLVTDLQDTSWVVAGWGEKPMVQVVGMEFEEINKSLQKLVKFLSTPPQVGVLMGINPNGPESVMDGLMGPSALPELVFQRMTDAAKLPTRGHDDDAGFDLYTSQDTIIKPGEFVDVPTGVAVDLPRYTWALITGRSSTLRKRGLLVTNGVIDEGYTGELYAGAQNLTNEAVVVEKGERICQLILLPAVGQMFRAQWGLVRNKERGANGFGSTGR